MVKSTCHCTLLQRIPMMCRFCACVELVDARNTVAARVADVTRIIAQHAATAFEAQLNRYSAVHAMLCAW